MTKVNDAAIDDSTAGNRVVEFGHAGNRHHISSVTLTPEVFRKSVRRPLKVGSDVVVKYARVSNENHKTVESKWVDPIHRVVEHVPIEVQILSVDANRILGHEASRSRVIIARSVVVKAAFRVKFAGGVKVGVRDGLGAEFDAAIAVVAVAVSNPS